MPEEARTRGRRSQRVLTSCRRQERCAVAEIP